MRQLLFILLAVAFVSVLQVSCVSVKEKPAPVTSQATTSTTRSTTLAPAPASTTTREVRSY